MEWQYEKRCGNGERTGSVAYTVGRYTGFVVLGAFILGLLCKLLNR